ncbi:fibronectin type III domain-containing protein [Nonomuraea endophytica]|uniref:Fibronectin type-III domain-containing protein n=1 Tax=Nonomuraea endophytica TaxID=714136 RepID=A0A7W8EK60_9ACTN|nr:fibronectin type III domain-containing protein [Nonomuraea endophytica]MBB5081387.1 hypothetical protein [Nonomuraea endophytica]
MQVIIPGERPRFGVRLVAHAPNGPRLGLLGAPLSWDAGLPLNDVPSLELTYTAHAQGAAWLREPCEVALEYSVDGGAWSEAANGRFLRIKRSGDATDQTGAQRFSLPGWAWMLRKLVLYPSLDMVDGKRQFNAVRVGRILTTLIAEGSGRGTLPGLVVDFTATHDSAGQPWSAELTIGLEPGTDLLQLLINLSEQGVCDWQMTGRVLQVYNEGTALGRQLAAGPAPVELILGRDIDQAPDDATLEDAASAILVVGEEGLRVEVTNPAAVAPWGRWEAFQQQGGVKDEGTARLLAGQALERASRERVQFTRQIKPQQARFLPLVDYRPGDTIRAPGEEGKPEPLRIRQITLSRGDDGVVGGNLTLNDRFLEREIKLARQAAGILNGGVSGGGNGGDPGGDNENRVPAAPTGLLVNPAAYLDDEGYAHGQITVSWVGVTSDVNGTPLTVDGYELVGQTPPGTGAMRVLATTTGTSVSYSPLEPKTRWQFGVRATNQGTRGVVAGTAVITIPDDETPPPGPSAPVVDSRIGIFRITWDGFTSAGTGMPTDFARVLIMMRDPLDLSDEGQQVEWLERAGTAVVPGQPYSVDREFWLVAIDRSGNLSGASAHVMSQAKPLVNSDMIGEIINGAEHIITGSIPANAKIVAGSITGGLIQALAIDAGKIAANAISADKIVAGAIDAAHIKANAVTADKIAAGSITAAKIDADALNGKVITGPVIRSSATGRRFVLDSSTLDLRFYPSGSSNYSRVYAEDSGGEAAVAITTNTSFSQRAELRVNSSLIRLGMISSGGGQSGGGLDIASSYARYGYSAGSSSTEASILFDGAGKWTMKGRVWEFTTSSAYETICAGSGVVSSGYVGVTITYGPYMAGNMGPVAVVRDGATTPNFYWCLDASSPSGFSIGWSSGGGVYSGKAFYFWSFRHPGSA